MSDGDYLIGLAFLVLTLGSVIAAALLLVRRRAAALSGATRIVAVAVLATAGVLLAHLLPGALTVLSRETAALTAVLLLACASRVRPAAAGGRTPTEPSDDPEPWPERLLAGFGVTVGVIWVALVAIRQIYVAPQGFDAANAYMPTAARWAQDGSIWGLHDWLPGFFFGASPGNGSVVVLAGLLPFDNDFLARYAIYPFVLLFAVALYALARELAAPRSAATLIALMVTAAPVVVQPALEDALLDPVLYFGVAAGFLFLVRHTRTAASSDLLIAGVALGIAFGTKFYGFTAVPIIVVVWLGARLTAGIPPRLLLRQARLLIGPIALFGGIWILRNLIATGNPVFPVQLDLFGITIFSAPADPLRESLGSTLFGYLDQPGVWSGELAHQFRVAVGIPLLLIAAGVVTGIVQLGRRRYEESDGRRDHVAWAALVAIALLALSYALTPYSAVGPPGEPVAAAANVRYGIPALIAASIVVAFVAGRLSRKVLLGVEVVALLALLDAIRIGITAPSKTLYTAVLLAAIALALVVLVRSLRGFRRRDREPGPDRHRKLALAAVALLALLAGSVRWQGNYNEGRYLEADAALTELIERTSEVEGVMVALAGNWTNQGVAPVYPSFGTTLQNDVDYVGPDQDGLLGRFTNQADFVAALDAGQYGLVVVGCGECPRGPLGGSLQARWATEAGYRPIARSDRLVLLTGSD